MEKKRRKENIYAFIDSQNLNLSVSKDIYRDNKLIYKGWKLDFSKFRKYLFDKLRVTKALLFIGYIKENQKLYQYLQSSGYVLIFKPTTKDHHGKPKGNVDAELVLHAAAVEYNHYDKAIIITGDGDYHCLLEYLEIKKKLQNLIIPNAKSESYLLKRFHRYKIFLDFEKDKLM